MAKTLLDLANRMEALAEEIRVAGSDTAVNVGKAIINDLAFKTPVDSSKALSNWIVTLGSASGLRIDPHYPGERGSTQGASAAQTIAEANATLASKKPGQTIFITNNLPYIKRLNDGYSRQAPAGFVERSVLIGRRKVRDFKLR